MGYQIQFLSFFLKKPIPFDLNPKYRFWGHIFSHICGSIGPIVSKNNRIYPWADPHQPCEFHENRIKTATCIVTSFLYIYICVSIITLRIRNLGPSKWKTWPTPPPPSEVERVRIVVISFRNIAKKRGQKEKKNTFSSFHQLFLLSPRRGCFFALAYPPPSPFISFKHKPSFLLKHHFFTSTFFRLLKHS